jgi:hypothetical protein
VALIAATQLRARLHQRFGAFAQLFGAPYNPSVVLQHEIQNPAQKGRLLRQLSHLPGIRTGLAQEGLKKLILPGQPAKRPKSQNVSGFLLHQLPVAQFERLC